jgi:hypothetical protein
MPKMTIYYRYGYASVYVVRTSAIVWMEGHT